MAQVIVVHWDTKALHAVVVGRRVAYTGVDAVLDIPLENSEEPREIGRQLAEALAPHRPSRATIFLAVGRDMLTWQHLELPPCPAEELPDLVQMQANFDAAHSTDLVGFDFLPLCGDEHTPHHVLAVSLEPAKLETLKEICAIANLNPKRIVPLSLGWPAAARRATRGDTQPVGIFVAPFAKEATIWATLGSRIVLFRQIYLPPADDLSALSAALASELRRTEFVLAQQHPDYGGASVWIAGKRPDNVSELTELLQNRIEDLEVQPMDFASDSALLSTKISNEISTSEALPLAGLALDESVGNAPSVDLLHPRKRSAPRTGQRTYALAAAAIFALFAYIGWHGYQELNAPVAKADVARAELALLAESEKELSEDQQLAETIRAWLDDSVNVLTELELLSKKIRPVPLDAENFPINDDVVLEQLNIGGRQMNLDAAVRTYPAVATLETRLREGTGRVQRETAEENDSPAGYDWFIRATVDFTEDVNTPREKAKP